MFPRRVKTRMQFNVTSREELAVFIKYINSRRRRIVINTITPFIMLHDLGELLRVSSISVFKGLVRRINVGTFKFVYTL